MANKASFWVKLTGTGISEEFEVLSHEVKDYKGSCYHVFELPNGAIVWFNDFGLRSIVFADDQPSLH